jgi:two-component system cell cycle response regulator
VSETGADATRPETTAVPGTGTLDRAVDPVSGLPDHRYFEIALGRHLAMARRGLRPLSLVMFELDGLENFAPYLRDHAMRVLTRTLSKTLRDSDTACRLNDSVVGVILDDTPDAGAVWAAERIRGALFASPAGDILTLSAGVACYPAHALEAAQLVESATRALDAARANGRDRVEVAVPVE